jgi:hypothetical protein
MVGEPYRRREYEAQYPQYLEILSVVAVEFRKRLYERR